MGCSAPGGAFLTHAFQPRLPYVVQLLLHLPLVQGARFRSRSAQNVVAEIVP